MRLAFHRPEKLQGAVELTINLEDHTIKCRSSEEGKKGHPPSGQARDEEPDEASFERRRLGALRTSRCARPALRSAREGGRRLTPPPRRRSGCTPPAAMANVSERTLQVSVLVAFASGVLVGWQANRLRRRYLDWRKRRLQDKLAMTQKKLDLA
ncbi:mitoregulin [Suricata suricatta]|nr:mitoregulin [Suricata suricatta]